MTEAMLQRRGEPAQPPGHYACFKRASTRQPYLVFEYVGQTLADRLHGGRHVARAPSTHAAGAGGGGRTRQVIHRDLAANIHWMPMGARHGLRYCCIDANTASFTDRADATDKPTAPGSRVRW
jgi:hypothetical protein